MMAHKTKVVGELTKGVEFLLKKYKSEAIVARSPHRQSGSGRRQAGGRHDAHAGCEEYRHRDRLPMLAALPGVTIDEERIVSSTGALALTSVPKRLIVVGGWLYRARTRFRCGRRLGSEVTVVEFLDRITPGLDGEIGKQFQRILQRQGMKFFLSTKVAGVDERRAKCSMWRSKARTAPNRFWKPISCSSPSAAVRIRMVWGWKARALRSTGAAA